MLQYLYYNYMFGIFMFIIDRLFLRINRTEEQDKELEAELKSELSALNSDINLPDGVKSFSQWLYNLAKRAENNKWLSELIVLIIFLIPILNLLIFFTTVNKKFSNKDSKQ